MTTDTKQLRELAEAALKPLSSFERPHLFRFALEEFEKSTTPNVVLELLDTIDAQRALLEQSLAALRLVAGWKEQALCNEITEHLKGTP